MNRYYYKVCIGCFLFMGTLTYAKKNPPQPDEETGGKVGINQPNPTRTLDVNGSVRMQEAGEAIKSSIPLGVNTENKQIVKLDPKSGEPFEIKRFIIPVPTTIDSQRNRVSVAGERVENYDLGIKYEFHEVVVSAVNLLKGTMSEGKVVFNTDAAPTMSIQGITETKLGDHSQYENGITDMQLTLTQYKGWLEGPKQHYMQGNLNSSTIQKPSPEDRNFLFYPVPKIFIKKDENTKTYKFYANYQDSEDILPEQGKYWVLDLLIINKEWIEDLPETTVMVHHNGQVGDRATIGQVSSGTHPAVNYY